MIGIHGRNDESMARVPWCTGRKDAGPRFAGRLGLGYGSSKFSRRRSDSRETVGEAFAQCGERRIEVARDGETFERCEDRGCLAAFEQQSDFIRKLLVKAFDRALGHVGLTERVRVMARAAQKFELRLEP